MKKINIILSALTLVLSTQLQAGDAAAGKAKAATCQACHGANGISILPLYPNLAGQKEQYLVKALKEFKSGVRTDPTMKAMAAPLTDDDVANLASYFSSLSTN